MEENCEFYITKIISIENVLDILSILNLKGKSVCVYTLVLYKYITMSLYYCIFLDDYAMQYTSSVHCWCC